MQTSPVSEFPAEFTVQSVLLVDHDDDARLMYGQFLRAAHIDVEEASGGPEALAKALTTSHDVVITDSYLPGMSGIELCKVLRADAATSTTPIVMIAAVARPEDEGRARLAGADAVLIKPFLPEALLGEIRRVIQRSRELRRESAGVRARVEVQRERSEILVARALQNRRALSRTFGRYETRTPPDDPPTLVCPSCDRLLNFLHSNIGGVSERHSEQWDYFECEHGCGRFQYRHRTKKLRKLR